MPEPKRRSKSDGVPSTCYNETFCTFYCTISRERYCYSYYAINAKNADAYFNKIDWAFVLNDRVKEEVYQIKYFGDNCLSRVLWMFQNTSERKEQMIYIEIIREL